MAKILSFFRYPDGSLEAMVSYPKTATVTKQVGHGPRPDGWTAAQWEAEFFRRLNEQIQIDVKSSDVDTSDVEGKSIDDLLRNAPAGPTAEDLAAAAANAAAAEETRPTSKARRTREK